MASRKKKTPPISFPKNREATHEEAKKIEADIAALEKLGFEVPSITVGEVGEPCYDISPPKDQAMHQWRMALETSGFEVVSKLNPDDLGFIAKRRVVEGKGWT